MDLDQPTSNILEVLLSKVDDLQKDITHLVVHLDKQEQTIERLRGELFYQNEKFIAWEVKR